MPESRWPVNTKDAGGSKAVQRLVKLPFKKSLEISIKSLRARFYRSLITTLSLVLAVSFLSYVRVGSDVANSLLTTGNPALRQALVRSGFDLGPEDTHAGSSPKQRWIIILSLVVCTVGIINAQLMAVTERFREIGTMKCLGALDRFILRLFLLESGMQGLAGAFAGALIGALFSVLGAGLHYGTVVFGVLPLADIAISIGLATGVGCLLSLLGVLYPAILAARMQPVDAMRVEH